MVMSDHVHAVIRLGEEQTLEKVRHSIRGYTAREVNKRLATEGAFWQKGYTDSGIRDDGINRYHSLLLCEPRGSRNSGGTSRLSALAMQISNGILIGDRTQEVFMVAVLRRTRLPPAPLIRGDMGGFCWGVSSRADKGGLRPAFQPNRIWWE